MIVQSGINDLIEEKNRQIANLMEQFRLLANLFEISYAIESVEIVGESNFPMIKFEPKPAYHDSFGKLVQPFINKLKAERESNA